MADDQEIILARVPWSDLVARHFQMIGYLPPHQSEIGIEAGIKTNDVFALGVFYKAEQVGTAFYQFDDGDQGTELFVIGAGGRLPGVDLALVVMPALEGIARETKCLSVAFDTARRGLVKKMAEKAGYQAKTVTMRKDLI